MINPLETNMDVIVRTIKFQARSVDDLVRIRKTSLYWAEAIDTRVPDTWCNLLTFEIMEKFFHEANEYLIEISLLARKWYDTENNWSKLEFIPDVAKFHFTHKFIMTTNLDIARVFVEHGYVDEPLESNGVRISALYHACAGNSWDKIKYLLEAGAKSGDAIGVFASTVGHYVLNGKTDQDICQMFDLFLKNGGDVNVALHTLSTSANRFIIDYLIERGANVNYQSPTYGNTVLANSVTDPPTEKTRFLIERTSDAMLNALNKEGLTALDIAMTHRCFETAILLLKRGAKISRSRYVTSIRSFAFGNEDNQARFEALRLGLERGATISDNDLIFTTNFKLLRLLVEFYKKRNQDDWQSKLKVLYNTPIPNRTLSFPRRTLAHLTAILYEEKNIETLGLVIMCGADPSHVFDNIPRGTYGYASEERQVGEYL
jgi:ankyrin repeat protein